MKVARIGAQARWPLWLAVAGLALFLFRPVSLEWSINAQYSYGWVVPILCAYLIYERTKDAPKVGPAVLSGPSKSLFAFLLLLLAAIRLASEANPDWRLLNWLAGLGIVALVWLDLYSRGRAYWRHFAFATAFILTAIAWPTELENLLVQSLMRGLAAITVEFLNFIGIAAQQEGNLIRLTSGTLGIDEACSGVRSFQATIMAALFLGELSRLNWKRRLVLVGIGVFLALLLNMSRAILLAVVAAKSGVGAVNKWHDPAGYVLLAVTFFGLLGIARVLSTRNARSSSHTDRPLAARWDHRSRGTPYLVVLSWLIVCEIGTQLWYRAHETDAEKAERWHVKWPYETEANFLRAPISETVRLVLRFNKGDAAIWSRADGSRWHLFFFEWEPGRAAASLARGHRPEVCLPATGFTFSGNRGLKGVRADLYLELERLEFKRGGESVLVYFVLWEDRRRISTYDYGVLTRANRIRAVVEGRRHLGQRVLEIVVTNPASAEKTDADVVEALRQWITRP